MNRGLRQTAALVVALFGLTGGSASADPTSHPNAACRAVRVPVTVAAAPGAQEPERYSYVRKALAAVYATFNVDRLGSGSSTRPFSTAVSFENGAEAMQDVITQLRSGSIYAWYEASHHDVDAFVLSANLLPTKPSYLGLAATNVRPTIVDPKFAGSRLDPGYTTTVSGTRGRLFYESATADPDVVAMDEALKDTTSATELAALGPIETVPPPLAPTRRSRSRPSSSWASMTPRSVGRTTARVHGQRRGRDAVAV